MDHRAIVALVSLAIFASVIPLNNWVGRDFIPADDQSEFTRYMNQPVGASRASTQRLATEIGDRIAKIPGVLFVNPFGNEESSHNHMYIRLVDVSQRKQTKDDIAAEVRKITAEYPNLRAGINMPSALSGGEGGWPINVGIDGPDLEVAGQYAHKIYDEMKKVPGISDIDMDLEVNSPELQVQIDRKRASELGVRASDVASAVRLMIAGQDEISTYKEGSEQYPVTMQLLPEQQKDPNMLAPA